MTGLDFALCDQTGKRLAWIRNRKGDKQVTIPLNGARYASCAVSFEDPAVDHVLPLARRLKGYLDGYLIFNGPLTSPYYVFHTDLDVQLYARDSYMYLDRAYVQMPANPKPDVDGKIVGFFRANTDQASVLVDLTNHPPSARIVNGAREHGIAHDSNLRPVTFPIDLILEPGKRISDAMAEITQRLGGVDVELQPRDTADGYMVTMATHWPLQGEDRSSQVRLQFGLGRFNATEVSYQPDGQSVVNYATVIGQSTSGQSPPRYTAQLLASRDLYGTFEYFGGNGDLYRTSDVQAEAQSIVSAQAFPPDVVTVQPALRGPFEGFTYRDAERVGGFGIPPLAGPRSNPDARYWVGDSIGVQAKRGRVFLNETMRVTELTFREADPAGNVQVTVTAAPHQEATGVS